MTEPAVPVGGKFGDLRNRVLDTAQTQSRASRPDACLPDCARFVPACLDLPRAAGTDLAAVNSFQRAVDQRVQQRFLGISLVDRDVKRFRNDGPDTAAFDGDGLCIPEGAALIARMISCRVQRSCREVLVQ